MGKAFWHSEWPRTSDLTSRGLIGKTSRKISNEVEARPPLIRLRSTAAEQRRPRSYAPTDWPAIVSTARPGLAKTA